MAKKTRRRNTKATDAQVRREADKALDGLSSASLEEVASLIRVSLKESLAATFTAAFLAAVAFDIFAARHRKKTVKFCMDMYSKWAFEEFGWRPSRAKAHVHLGQRFSLVDIPDNVRHIADPSVFINLFLGLKGLSLVDKADSVGVYIDLLVKSAKVLNGEHVRGGRDKKFVITQGAFIPWNSFRIHHVSPLQKRRGVISATAPQKSVEVKDVSKTFVAIDGAVAVYVVDTSGKLAKAELIKQVRKLTSNTVNFKKERK